MSTRCYPILRASLAERDAALVSGKPRIEALQRGVQSPGEVDAACAAEVLFEVALELKHVAKIVGAREAAAAVHVRRHVVVANFLTERSGESLSHLRAGEHLTRDADDLADVFLSMLEDAVGASADVLGGDSRELLVAHGKRDGKLAVRPLFLAHAEVNQIVPVERRQEKRHRQTEIGEQVVGLALAVKVRHLVLVLEGGHAIVAQRHPLARVLESRPDDMLEAGLPGRLGHRAGLGDLLLRREVRPEKRHTVGPVSARKRLLQALRVVDVGPDHLGALLCQLFRLVRVGVAGQGARGEAATRVAQNRTREPVALCAGRTCNGNDLLIGHPVLLSTISAASGCVARLVDLAHPSRSDRREDPVGTEAISGCECQAVGPKNTPRGIILGVCGWPCRCTCSSLRLWLTRLAPTSCKSSARISGSGAPSISRSRATTSSAWSSPTGGFPTGRARPWRRDGKSSRLSRSAGIGSIRPECRSHGRWTGASWPRRWRACAGSSMSSEAGSATRSSTLTRAWGPSTTGCSSRHPSPALAASRSQNEWRTCRGCWRTARRTSKGTRSRLLPASRSRSSKTSASASPRPSGSLSLSSRQKPAGRSKPHRREGSRRSRRFASGSSCGSAPCRFRLPSGATTTSSSCRKWRCCRTRPSRFLPWAGRSGRAPWPCSPTKRRRTRAFRSRRFFRTRPRRQRARSAKRPLSGGSSSRRAS